MVKIIIDAFGGDNSPGEVIKGAIGAINQNAEIHTILCGKQDVIENELSK